MSAGFAGLILALTVGGFFGASSLLGSVVGTFVDILTSSTWCCSPPAS